MFCRCSNGFNDSRGIRRSAMSMEDKFQPSFRKEGPLSATSSGGASSRLATDMRFGDLLESPLDRVALSLPAAYPKGITFPLGSCLSGTNSRNSRRLLPAEQRFFPGKSSYQWFGRTAMPFTLRLLIWISPLLGMRRTLLPATRSFLSLL